ncbi:MAG: hypothetical protein VW202_03865 [Halieaceae bacterium]
MMVSVWLGLGPHYGRARFYIAIIAFGRYCKLFGVIARRSE